MVLTEIKKHIKTDKVLDLYSGVGTIGLSVARDKKLTLVECDQSAFDEMVRNITIKDISRLADNDPTKSISTANHVQNDDTLAVLAKSENALDYIESNQTIILDPPRAGCDRRLIDKLLEVTPAKIIYLSCNPATQARDVSLLLEKYHISAVKTYNFFPRTPHIENLIVLSL